MLNLSGELRRQLWNCANWADVLGKAMEDTMASPSPTTDCAHRAIVLANIAEDVVPDSHRIAALYSWAWRIYANPEWIHRAITLVTEAGDHHTRARFITEQYQRIWAGPLVEQAVLAHLDAGNNDAAALALQNSLERFREHSNLRLLLKAALGFSRDFTCIIETLKTKAASLAPHSRATTLLLAARLAASTGTHNQRLLQDAFLAAPSEEGAFTLLENLYIEKNDCDQLRNLYEVRSENASDGHATIEVYRSAGSRLLARAPDSISTSQRALGVAILQKYTHLIFDDSLEVPKLISTLKLLVDNLSHQSAIPTALRILAKALAHPRSDDEVMWIVNTGLEFAANDHAHRRTASTFEDLRQRVLLRHPDIVLPNSYTESQTVSSESLAEAGRPRKCDLENIHDEVEELTKTKGAVFNVEFRDL